MKLTFAFDRKISQSHLANVTVKPADPDFANLEITGFGIYQTQLEPFITVGFPGRPTQRGYYDFVRGVETLSKEDAGGAVQSFKETILRTFYAEHPNLVPREAVAFLEGLSAKTAQVVPPAPHRAPQPAPAKAVTPKAAPQATGEAPARSQTPSQKTPKRPSSPTPEEVRSMTPEALRKLAHQQRLARAETATETVRKIAGNAPASVRPSRGPDRSRSR